MATVIKSITLRPPNTLEAEIVVVGKGHVITNNTTFKLLGSLRNAADSLIDAVSAAYVETLKTEINGEVSFSDEVLPSK